ncbi:MAG: RICIN domain-containing protein, partial [Oscillospiraceae bacterium]|nr:RICIN domain-containing protein [Oscillospiraceae bacterium]
GNEWHEVRVHEMFFNEDGWPVVTPFEFGGDHISEGGYEEADIVGDYEFINHGMATDGKVISYQNISLNADHTVSGAVSGTWEQAEESAAAVITVGGQRYSGYFLAAENEKGKQVMSFTAVGSNNQTVWGAQNVEYTGTPRDGVHDYLRADASLVLAPDTVGEESASLHLGGSELLSGATYFIFNKNSGLSLDLSAGKLDDGTNIQQWERNNLWAQQWRLVAVDDTYFRIVSLGDETKCIAVAENSGDNGGNIELQTYSGADNQLFTLTANGSYYGIVSKCSGGQAGLDVFEWSTENGGNVNQWEYWGGDCQLWRLTPVCPAIPDGRYILTDVNTGERTPVSMTKQEDGNYAIDNGSFVVENVALRANRDGSYALNDIDYAVEPQRTEPQKIIGDVDANDVFDLLDIIMMQKYLLNAGTLTDWESGDLCADGVIDVFDLALMKRELLKQA